MGLGEFEVEIHCLTAIMGEHRGSFCAGPGLGARGQQQGASRLILLVVPQRSPDGSVGN